MTRNTLTTTARAPLADNDFHRADPASAAGVAQRIGVVFGPVATAAE